MRLQTLTIASLSLVPALALGAPVVVPGGSFEGATGYGAPAGWSSQLSSTSPTQYSAIEVKSSGATGVTGSNYIVINVDHNGGPGDPVVPAEGSLGVLYSGSLGTFAANTQYTLNVAVGRGINWPDWQDEGWAGIGLSNSALTMATQNATNTALFGHSGFTADNALTEKTFTLSTAAHPELVGQNVVVNLVFLSKMTYGRNAIFDNVRLDATPIPEPSGLSAVAALGLLALRRRR